MNHALFQRECEILLKRVGQGETAKAMLEDTSHPSWAEPAFKTRWDKVYGDHFDEHMEEVRKALAAIQKELERIHDMQPQTKSPAQNTPLKDKIQIKFYWMTKGKKKIFSLSDTLTSTIEHIRILREQASEIIQLTPALVQMQTPTMPPPRRRLPTDILDIREVSKQLFGELAATANCSCHRVNLRLQLGGRNQIINTSGGRGKNVTSFQLIATCEQQDNTSISPRCTCLTINSSLEEPVGLPSVTALPSTSGTKKRLATSMVSAVKRMRLSDQHLNETSATRCDISLNVSINDEAAAIQSTTTTTTSTSSATTTTTTTTSTSANFRTVEDLCSLLVDIQSSDSVTEMHGVIRRAGYSYSTSSFRHTIYLNPREQQPSQRISLQEILKRPDRQYFFPREQRLKTAYLLALSLLQFGNSSRMPWFQERWRSRDIYYFLDLSEHEKNYTNALEPYVTPEFPARPKAACKGKGKAIDIPGLCQDLSQPPLILLPNGSTYIPPPTSPDSQYPGSYGIARNEQLFSLAIVLIEIAFGCPLFDIYEPKGGIGHPKRNGQDNMGPAEDDIQEYLKAKRIVQWHMLAKEMGQSYAKVVRKCLFGDLGDSGNAPCRNNYCSSGEYTGADRNANGNGPHVSSNLVAAVDVDLERRELQELFWGDVVCELEKLQLSE